MGNSEYGILDIKKPLLDGGAFYYKLNRYRLGSGGDELDQRVTVS